MKSLRFKKIDAFTGPRSSGNPAGAVYLERPDELSVAEMQRVAAECKGWLSEVGFVAKLGAGHYWLRYYSSEREVDFCGHATIAIAYDLIAGDPSLRDAPSIRLSTKKAEVRALNQIAAHDAVYISAPPAVISARSVPSSECARALGLARPTALGFRAIINAGLETLIVEIASLAEELALAPDLHALRLFCESIGVDIVLAYSAETSNPGSAFRTRVFAPRFGYLEDPATGSGNAAFGYHLLASGAWSQGRLLIEQNGSHEQPNFVSLALEGQGGERPGLLFGGGAQVKIDGEYLLREAPR